MSDIGKKISNLICYFFILLLFVWYGFMVSDKVCEIIFIIIKFVL